MQRGSSPCYREKRRANDAFSFAAPLSLIPKVGGKIAQ
jgi:hypothetical protein